MKQKTAARKYRRGDDEDHRLRRGDVDDERPEEREPERERGVEGQREDPVRREQLACARRRTGSSPPRPARRTTVTVEIEEVQQQDQREVRADEVQRDERGAAQEVRGDEDDPPVDAVDVDAGDRREQHRRDEEREDQQADDRVRARSSSTTMTVSPYRTMLPPIWVAACDSQRRRNAPLRKTARALSLGRRGLGRRPALVTRPGPTRAA